jgi:von Willebrand factor type A domain
VTASAIPATEAARLRPSVRRTAVLRAALALALAATLALAFLVARGYDPRVAPLVPAGSTGMVVIDLSASVYEGAMEETLQKLARAGEQAGLVVFSDVGYELLPPGTPGRELLPIIRYLKPVGTAGELPVNPWQDFRAGTRISAGLEVAREALLRERVRRGSVVLISDLDILPDEVQRLAAEIAELKRNGMEVRIVPLDPTPEKVMRIEALTSPSALLRAPGKAGEVRAPEQHSLREALPWTFVFAAALLVGLLALNERLLARLEVRR